MTSGDLKSSYSSQDYFEFRKVLSSKDEPVRHLLCGSFFELPLLYFLSNPTDFDIMFCDMTLCAMYDHVNVPATHARNVLTIDSTDCHVGFVRLRNGVDYFRKPLNLDIGNGPACTTKLPIQTTYLRALFGMVYNRWRDIFILYKDHVYTLSCPLWPPEAHEWITRKRLNGWPTDNIVERIVKGGCHLVSKPHGKNPNDDTQWRYSFSQAETILIHNTWTPVQKYIYHLLRIVKRHLVLQCGGNIKTFISNYYIKTLMLWSCEEKPAEFWEDRNIVTSVRELLLDFIEKLIERKIPHYFMPENNIMDDLACNSDVENEIRFLISHMEEDIAKLIIKEPKAFEIDSGFVIIPNHTLYPVTAKLSQIVYLSKNKFDDESTIISICSSYNVLHELEYLYKGIMMHLQLSKLNKHENKKRRQEAQDCIASAEELFDLSIRKLEYGFTSIRLNLGWSVSETYQQLWIICGGKHEQNQNLMLYSGSCGPETASRSGYLEDGENSLENQCSISPGRLETSIFPFLQEIILKEITLPVNSSYFLCSAYRANFFCNAVCNYKQAFDLCNEVIEQRNCLSFMQEQMFAEFLPFPLKNEWSGLYDRYIQILLGFLTLYRTLTASQRAKMQMISFYLCSLQYLKYIYTRCCRILSEPAIADFSFGYERLCGFTVSIMRHKVG